LLRVRGAAAGRLSPSFHPFISPPIQVTAKRVNVAGKGAKGEGKGSKGGKGDYSAGKGSGGKGAKCSGTCHGLRIPSCWFASSLPPLLQRFTVPAGVLACDELHTPCVFNSFSVLSLFTSRQGQWEGRQGRQGQRRQFVERAGPLGQQHERSLCRRSPPHHQPQRHCVAERSRRTSAAAPCSAEAKDSSKSSTDFGEAFGGGHLRGEERFQKKKERKLGQLMCSSQGSPLSIPLSLVFQFMFQFVCVLPVLLAAFTFSLRVSFCACPYAF